MNFFMSENFVSHLRFANFALECEDENIFARMNDVKINYKNT